MSDRFGRHASAGCLDGSSNSDGGRGVGSARSGGEPERYGVGVGEQNLLVHEAVGEVEGRSVKRARRAAADEQEPGGGLGGGDQQRPGAVPQRRLRLDVGVAQVQRPELEALDALLVERALVEQACADLLGVEAREGPAASRGSTCCHRDVGVQVGPMRVAKASRSPSMSDELAVLVQAEHRVLGAQLGDALASPP